MWNMYRTALTQINGFTDRQWFFILVGAVVVGAMCLRGFGSRSNY